MNTSPYQTFRYQVFAHRDNPGTFGVFDLHTKEFVASYFTDREAARRERNIRNGVTYCPACDLNPCMCDKA